MTRPLLTIAIPTHNGATHISRTIESILSELCESVSSLVHILISDNASDDDSWNIIESYARAHPKLFTTVRQHTNIGFDRNVDFLFTRADGEYVWVLADDDALAPGGIGKLLAILQASPGLNLVFVGGSDIEADGMLCTDGDEFLLASGFGSGGVSANVVKRVAWNGVGASRYYGSGWVHFGVIIDLAAMSYPAYVFKDALQSPMALHKRWGGGGAYIVVGLSLVEIFKRMHGLGYRRETVKLAQRTVKGPQYWRWLCKAKADGLEVNLRLISRFASLFYLYPSFWLKDLPVLLLPRRACVVVYKAYCLVRSASTRASTTRV
jgi:glycosyltransferase involved in cell wall biosynthesis